MTLPRKPGRHGADPAPTRDAGTAPPPAGKPTPALTAAAAAAAAARAAREAAALRANLHRRKAQSRARQAPPAGGDMPEEPG